MIVFVGICITLLTVPPFPAPKGFIVFRSSARKSSLNSTPSSKVAICSLMSVMGSALIVSSMECALSATLERTREALDPGTCASAALEAGLEASLGEGRLRFFMLRALALAATEEVVVGEEEEEGIDPEDNGGDIIGATSLLY